MKKCQKCDISKDLDSFPKNKSKSSGLSGYCKPCSVEASLVWQKKNKDKLKEYNKNWRLRNIDKERAKSIKWAMENPDKKRNKWLKTYGINVEIYDKMFAEQQGKCAICGGHQSSLKKALNVDHDHSTGKVRGLLCWNCNVGIGQMKDSTDSLRAAIKYLEKAEAQNADTMA